MYVTCIVLLSSVRQEGRKEKKETNFILVNSKDSVTQNRQQRARAGRNIECAVFLLILDTQFTRKPGKPTEWKSRKPMLRGRVHGIQGHSPSFKCVQVQCSSSLLARTQHLGVCGEQSWVCSSLAVQYRGRSLPGRKWTSLCLGKHKAPQEPSGHLSSAFPKLPSSCPHTQHPEPNSVYKVPGILG